MAKTRWCFLPLAFTGVCTGELCDITAGLGSYTDLNADVVAISVDSPFAQGQWAEKENIGITLASDLNKQTAKDYGVLLDDLIGLGSVSARGFRDRQGRHRAIRRANGDAAGTAQL